MNRRLLPLAGLLAVLVMFAGVVWTASMLMRTEYKEPYGSNSAVVDNTPRVPGLAAEKAAQYASRTMELEQRVRILEQIVTDRGAETASQIEALRKQPRLPVGDQTK